MPRCLIDRRFSLDVSRVATRAKVGRAVRVSQKVIAIIAFSIARWAILALYVRPLFFRPDYAASLVGLVVSWTLAIFGIPFALDRALGEIRWRLVPILFAAFAVVMPLSRDFEKEVEKTGRAHGNVYPIPKHN